MPVANNRYDSTPLQLLIIIQLQFKMNLIRENGRKDGFYIYFRGIEKWMEIDFC